MERMETKSKKKIPVLHGRTAEENFYSLCTMYVKKKEKKNNNASA